MTFIPQTLECQTDFFYLDLKSIEIPTGRCGTTALLIESAKSTIECLKLGDIYARVPQVKVLDLREAVSKSNLPPSLGEAEQWCFGPDLTELDVQSLPFSLELSEHLPPLQKLRAVGTQYEHICNILNSSCESLEQIELRYLDDDLTEFKLNQSLRSRLINSQAWLSRWSEFETLRFGSSRVERTWEWCGTDFEACFTCELLGEEILCISRCPR